LSATLTKNCEVALWGSEVRAIEMVPRSFFRPLSASFWIGSRVFFCSIAAVKPPPWTTNPGITRWKTVPS
jgi:hypothetical protein